VAKVSYVPQADDDLESIVYCVARDTTKCRSNMVGPCPVREPRETLATQPELGEQRQGFGVPSCKSFNVGNYVVFFRAIEDGIEV